MTHVSFGIETEKCPVEASRAASASGLQTLMVRVQRGAKRVSYRKPGSACRVDLRVARLFGSAFVQQKTPTVTVSVLLVTPRGLEPLTN